ncbi:LysR substrate-binding domain-containing protein [Alkanindiges sp. WGS2144]|uniref:LysR substrate-binding domain-containing protein n=1 Tax=Alkanindiges sp. WGS2144 TaxID=3366808 RepID=UPI0037536D54
MKSNLDELIAFKTVVDTGSITAAANELEQTISGVSRSLNRLEQKLNVTLLERTTRRIKLTDEGAQFLKQVRQIINALELAEEDLQLREQQPSGHLRVNAAYPFMKHVIVPLVGQFRQRYPKIELELNTDDLVIDLLAKQTDVAIRIGPLPDSSLHARFLGNSRRRILASPAYLQQYGTPRQISELAQHRLIGFSQSEHLNHWPLKNSTEPGYKIEPTLGASSGETIRELALAGQGIVCLSDFMTRQDMFNGQLLQILAEHTLEEMQPIHAVYYRNARLSARISRFIDFLAECQAVS